MPTYLGGNLTYGAPSLGFAGQVPGQTWDQWFGKPTMVQPVDAGGYTSVPQTAFELPVAYHGRSLMVRDIIQKIVISKNDWYVKLMPLEQTNDLTVAWSVFTYDPVMLEALPYGGTPSLVQSKIEHYSTKLRRYGISIQMQHGFMMTPDGQHDYFNKMETIVDSTLLAVYSMILNAILAAQNQYRNWDLKAGRPCHTVAEALGRHKMRFGVINKSMVAFRHLQATVCESMALRNVNPDMLIIPPKTKILMANHESEYDYSHAGPLSQKVRKEGGPAYDKIRDLEVVETRLFTQLTAEGEINPLRRRRECGSFFSVTNFHKSAHLDTYRSKDRFAARILDAVGGGRETLVTGRQLFELCQRFDGNGRLHADHYAVINSISEMRRRLRDNSGSNHVDMFIGHDLHRDPKKPDFLMEYFGEMWDEDVSRDDIRDFATTAINKFAGFSDEERRAVDEATAFMTALNKIDFAAADHVAYANAITKSGTEASGINRPAGSNMFKDNGLGCITLPEYKRDATTGEGSFQWGSGTGAEKVTAGPAAPKPLGFGHPTGLRTLAQMYTTGQYKGYDEETLRQATIHYSTLVKVYSIWAQVFPEHELGAATACPYYFATGNDKLDRITAFGLNLYDHARYPAHAVSTAATLATVDGVMKGRVEAALAKLGLDVTMSAAVAAALSAGKDPQLFHELAEVTDLDAFHARTSAHYRGRTYQKDGKPLTMDEFLKEAYAKGDANKGKGGLAVAAVLEVLILAGDKQKAVNWNEVIKKSEDRTAQLYGKNQADPKKFPTAGKTATLITRVCIDPESFRLLSDLAKTELRPMNVLFPDSALGVTVGTGTAADINDLKYASAPAGRNTVSSLTVSGHLARHVAGAGHTGAAFTAASSAFQGTKRRMFGGRVVGNSAGNGGGDAKRLREHGQAAIPFRANVYGDSGVAETDPAALPANLTLWNSPSLFVFDAADVHGAGGEMGRAYRHDLIARFHDWAAENNGLRRIFAQSWLTCNIRRQALENFYDQDVICPVAFELHRPRQVYNMGSAIIAQSGHSLGTCYYGRPDFEWADDASTKTHKGFYDVHIGAAVRDPNRFLILEDVVAMGAVPGGEDVNFCRDAASFTKFMKSPKVSAEAGCILVKMVPYNKGTPASPQDLSGRWGDHITALCKTADMTDEEYIHGSSVYYYGKLNGLDQINQDMVDSASMQFSNKVVVPNTVEWLGFHRIYNPVSKEFDTIIQDDGPFGEHIYKGCITDRDLCGNGLKTVTWDPSKIFA